MQIYKPMIAELFESKRRFVIPLFQRQYVWDQETKWEPLWEDIRSQAADHADDGPEVTHFLGAIVLSQRPHFNNQVKAHDVIDGQQRLTTFQIFLAALRDVAHDLGQGDIAEELQGLTINSGLVENDSERLKVWPTASDQDTFTFVVKARSRDEIAQRFGKKPPLLAGAYLYFYAAITEFAQDADDAPTADRLHALYRTVLRRLQLVSIELEGHEDPQVIFETLNARGEPLLPSDLLRNYILLRANRQGESANDLYQRYWSSFDTHPAADNANERYWKQEEKQGRLKRARLDILIHSFLAMKLQREVNIGRLYQEYRRWIEGTKPFPTVEGELEALQRHGAIFASLLSPDTTTRLGQFAERMRALDVSTVYPLILYLLGECDLKPAQLDAVITDIESYIVRRVICEKNSKNYNRFFLQVIREASQADTDAATAVRQCLLAQGDTHTAWPNDVDFTMGWHLHGLYEKRGGNKRALTILLALEQGLRNTKRESVTVAGPLTIEHVMPQSWKEHWPLPNSGSQTAGEALDPAVKRELLIQTAGNLTLLTGPLNSSVGNAPYDKRRSEITKHSALALNSYFQDQETWDEQAIVARSKALCNLAQRIWPHPG